MNGEWVMKRNCSLTPRQAGLALCLLCAVTLAVATAFLLLQAAWWILAYAVLETALATLAFLYYARHAGDTERIRLAGGALEVGRLEAGKLELMTLDARRTRVALPRSSTDMISLQAGSRTIEVGRYVNARQRREVARELSLALDAERRPAAAFPQLAS